jgi:hypothetical protein
MNKEYTIQKNTKNDFANISNESSYSCQGSECSCKYLHSRTEYDKQQYLLFQKENDIDYEKNMFISFKKKF